MPTGNLFSAVTTTRPFVGTEQFPRFGFPPDRAAIDLPVSDKNNNEWIPQTPDEIMGKGAVNQSRVEAGSVEAGYLVVYSTGSGLGYGTISVFCGKGDRGWKRVYVSPAILLPEVYPIAVPCVDGSLMMLVGRHLYRSKGFAPLWCVTVRGSTAEAVSTNKTKSVRLRSR